MRNRFKFISVALSCLLVGLAATIAGEESEVVKLEELPAAAQKTIQAETGEGRGKLGEIEKVTENGETRYDVELDKGKVERTFSVSPEGKLLGWQVFIREVPEAVRKAIHHQVEVAKAKLGDIDRVTEDGKVTFEVEMNKDGRQISFSVDADGKLLALEVTLEETPAAVQKTIREKTVGGTLKSIDKNTAEEEVAYDVEAEKGGRKITFSVGADGTLLPE